MKTGVIWNAAFYFTLRRSKLLSCKLEYYKFFSENHFITGRECGGFRNRMIFLVLENNYDYFNANSII